jgi:arylsulfatase A-like enzyme
MAVPASSGPTLGRRGTIGLGLVLLFVVLFFLLDCDGSSLLAAAEIKRQNRPNFIIILIDDLGWRDLGCYGNQLNETPNIDRLAKQGVRFTNAYASCAVCSPTRASLLTGKYPARLHLTDIIQRVSPTTQALSVPAWTPYLPLEEVTIAEVLRPAGYATAHVGKWHLGGHAGLSGAGKGEEGDPRRQGFDRNIAGCDLGQPPDYFFPYKRTHANGRTDQLTKDMPEGREGDYLTDRLTDEAVAFIKQNRKSPFFLYFSPYAVHTSMGARLQAEPRALARHKARSKHTSAERDPVYAAMVEHMDESVGQLLDTLTRLGIADQTVVIFSSDNGGLGSVTSNAPLRGAKATPYEGGIRVPLIIRWPGVAAPGTLCSVPAITPDLFPTVQQMADITPLDKSAIDGESLVPLLTQSGALHRKSLFWHFPHYGGTEPYGVVRQGEYKLIEFYEDGRQELYHLKKDPGETKDLSLMLPEVRQNLSTTLQAWRTSVGAQMPTPNPARRQDRR